MRFQPCLRRSSPCVHPHQSLLCPQLMGAAARSESRLQTDFRTVIPSARLPRNCPHPQLREEARSRLNARPKANPTLYPHRCPLPEPTEGGVRYPSSCRTMNSTARFRWSCLRPGLKVAAVPLAHRHEPSNLSANLPRHFPQLEPKGEGERHSPRASTNPIAQLPRVCLRSELMEEGVQLAGRCWAPS